MSRWICLLMLLLPPAPAWAQKAAVPPPPVLRIPRVSRAPQLVDFLNGNAREGEAKVTAFVQRYPKNGQAPGRETVAYISYDDKNLYIVFHC